MDTVERLLRGVRDEASRADVARVASALAESNALAERKLELERLNALSAQKAATMSSIAAISAAIAATVSAVCAVIALLR